MSAARGTRTRLRRAEEEGAGGKLVVGVAARRTLLQRVVASGAENVRRRDAIWKADAAARRTRGKRGRVSECGMAEEACRRVRSQEEVESPTGRVPCDIRPDAPVESLPAVAGLDVLEGRPYCAADAALGFVCCYLELDLEEVEGVHAEDGDNARAEPRKGMVLDGRVRAVVREVVRYGANGAQRGGAGARREDARGPL